MSAVDPNSAPVIVIPGPSGASIPAAASAVIVDTPSRAVVTDGSGAGAVVTFPALAALLGVAPALNDLATGVPTNGNGAAAVVASEAVLSMPQAMTSAYGYGSWTAPRVKLAPLAAFPGDVRVYARLVACSGDSNTWAYFGTVSEVDNYFRGWRVRCIDGQAGVRSDGATLVTPGTINIDGTGWVAYERFAGSEAWFYGNGTTSTPPPVWLPGRTEGNTTVRANALALALVKTDTAVAGSCSWGSVYVEAL